MMDKFTYIHFGVAQAVKSNNIAETARKLERCINEFCKDGRDKSLALTKLEECVMWANKSIAKEQ